MVDGDGGGFLTIIGGETVKMVFMVVGLVMAVAIVIGVCCRIFSFHIAMRFTRGTVLVAPHRSTFLLDRGLDSSIVASFPVIAFTQQLFICIEDNLCTICLGDYEEKEALRVLPKCGHTFHVTCIDAWLQQHSTCPICRVSLKSFPEWRSTRGPLISLSAKLRFSPGALPDSLFEQPSGPKSILVTVPTEHSEGKFSHPISKPVTLSNRDVTEMGGCSFSCPPNNPNEPANTPFEIRERLPIGLPEGTAENTKDHKV